MGFSRFTLCICLVFSWIQKTGALTRVNTLTLFLCLYILESFGPKSSLQMTSVYASKVKVRVKFDLQVIGPNDIMGNDAHNLSPTLM